MSYLSPEDLEELNEELEAIDEEPEPYPMDWEPDVIAAQKEEEEDFQAELEFKSILLFDDKVKLREMLKEMAFPYDELLLECMQYEAKECTRWLVFERGGTPPKPDEDYSIIPLYGLYLFSAACGMLCDPLIIDLLIKKCGYLPLINDQSKGVLPIHETLRKLRLSQHLEKWSVGQSMFKLLILLCLPQTRPILECVKLLAQYTKGVEEIACYCAKDGGLMELAALLLVARHKVLVPMSGEYEDNPSFERDLMDNEAIGVDISDMCKYKKLVRGLHVGLTIKQHIIFDLRLPTPELYNVFDESYEEMEMSLKDSLKLLHVFEKSGDAFDAYLQSDQSNVPVEQVIISIGLLLKKAGFNLEWRDIDLTDTDRFDLNT